VNFQEGIISYYVCSVSKLHWDLHMMLKITKCLKLKRHGTNIFYLLMVGGSGSMLKLVLVLRTLVREQGTSLVFKRSYAGEIMSNTSKFSRRL